MGLPREIQEVRNAFTTYDQITLWQPYYFKHLLMAHQALMHNLVDDSGRYRNADIGIYRNNQLIHMAPPASQVNRLMKDLLSWVKSIELHPLLVSCLFHYEFEFIHPFTDGNGRMGRLWQTLILFRWKPELLYLPVETVIRDQQEDYYTALRTADRESDSTVFVEFLLQSILLALSQALVTIPLKETTYKTTEKYSKKMVDKIVDYLSGYPEITISEMAKELGLTDDGIRYHLKKLKTRGKIERVGGRKSGRWQVNK